MPYRVTFALDLNDRPQTQPRALYCLNRLLECLFRIDVEYLRARPTVPPFDKSGVRYVEEPVGQEDWQDIPTTLQMGIGDAEDLGAWYAAEEVVRRGRNVVPVFVPNPPLKSGLVLYRVGLQAPNGAIELLPSQGSPASAFRRVTFALDLFNGPHERELSRKALRHMLECLYLIDVDYLRRYPNTPPIYTSGVRYMEEPPGQEDWQDVPTSLKMGISDCEDVAAWRAAERTVHGDLAWPDYLEQPRPDGSTLFHIIVKDRLGRTEDPSAIMGMR